MKKTSSLPIEQQYFDFEFGPAEVFVQAGCYIGDTVEEFIKFRGNNPKDMIYTFEVDRMNYEAAKRNLSKYPNVYVSQLGLWNKEDMLFFSDGQGPRSRVIEFSEDDRPPSFPVTALDTFFQDKPVLPTFIEFDIEGAEPEALLGAKGILQRAKPKLAICVYHNQDHLYRIPQIIKEANPEYSRFRFVQTADDALTDTILFAD